MIGRSVLFRRALAEARAVAPTRLPVLILGETGTGKDLLAQAIHRESGRKHFVPINAARFNGDVGSSELFGHIRGAFTGAQTDQVGLLQQAHHGTLFLDEVGELSESVQASLLRVLDGKAVRPVGSRTATSVDIRLLTATNRDLRHEVAKGRFRPDLFARISAFRIWLPSLRDRRDDIGPFIAHFLDGYPYTGAVVDLLRSRRWPLNIRGLRNELSRAVVMAKGERLEPHHFPLDTASVSEAYVAPGSDWPTLQEVERLHINRTLLKFRGNRSKAAEALGIHRNTLAKRLRRYGGLDSAG